MQIDPLTQRLEQLGAKKSDERSLFQSWVDDVEGLYQTAQDWLKNEIQAGVVRPAEQGARVQEPDGDSYEMRQLALQFDAGPLILLIPRSRQVVGAILKDGPRISNAKGRVDLVNFNTRRTVGLFRADAGRWLVPTPDEAEMWAVLDKARFRAAVAELLA